MVDRPPGSLSAAAESRLATVVLATAVAWAAVLGSNFLQISSWIVGDIAYHRGVAYTMQGVAWQGEGPFVGLLSYYGGLYPLVLGRLAGVLALPFDLVLSVASWGLALLWPLACWWLARRIWPGRRLAVALFVLLAVSAAPFTHRVLVWVDSPLASAQNSFPTYPRDLALILVLVAAGCALSTSRRGRVVGTGLALGGIVLVHLQIAIVPGWILGVWALLTAVRARTLRPVVELIAAGLVGVVISAWWWLPRVAATIQSGGLWLGGYPGSPPLRIGPDNIFAAFGVVAILALLGLSILAARRPLPGRLAFPFVWLAACLPLIAVDRLLGGSDLLSERRAWLLMSIPLTVLAAATATVIAGRLRPLLAVGFLIVVVIGPSVPGTIASVRLVRTAWEPGRAGGRIFDPAAWDPIFADLSRRVRADGRHVAVTYDAYETWVWSLSGAQVPSLWLPGPFKLGFDPARLTGLGYLDRLAAQETAFDGGRQSICTFARSFEAGSIILDVEQGMVGTFDESPASPYRVDPRQRSAATIERVVGPGLTYFDRGGQDVLHLDAGTRWQPGFRAPGASLLAVEFLVAPPPDAAIQADPLGTISTALGRVSFGQGLPPGPARIVVPVTGVDDRVAIQAQAPFDLIRVTAFDPLPDLSLAVHDGPVRLSPATFCPAT
jgi:hypothetical protein